MEEKSQQVPEDVIVEILLRLPVKYLVRFRCICVRWSSLIRDPMFVNLHFKRATTIDHLKRGFLLHRHLHEPSKYIISLLSNNDSVFELSTDIDVHDYLGPLESNFFAWARHEVRDLKVFGSCHGIICLGNCLNYYTLVNPATRERKILPHPPNGDNLYLMAVGFGFDSKNNDYKLVRIFDNIIHLYSLRRNSWRTLKINDCPTPENLSIAPTCASVCIQGVCHWLGREFKRLVWENEITFTIISFDLVDEVLAFVPMPVPIEYLDGYIMEWNGNIGVVGYYFSYHDQNFYDIWRMGENGVQESLTRLSNWRPMYKKGIIPLGFWKQNEFIIISRYDGCLISYNLSTQEFKNHHIQVRGCEGFGTLVETLVSIEDHVKN